VIQELLLMETVRVKLHRARPHTVSANASTL